MTLEVARIPQPTTSDFLLFPRPFCVLINFVLGIASRFLDAGSLVFDLLFPLLLSFVVINVGCEWIIFGLVFLQL